MPSSYPVFLWHAAASALHRQVAVTAFLRMAQAARLAVFCDPDDPFSAELGNLLIDVPVHRIAAADDGSDQGVAWIGTHSMDIPYPCHGVYSLPHPPRIILCLDDALRSRKAPPQHQPYITGQLWFAPVPDSVSTSGTIRPSRASSPTSETKLESTSDK